MKSLKSIEIPIYLYIKDNNDAAKGMYHAIINFFEKLSLTYGLYQITINEEIENEILKENEDLTLQNLLVKDDELGIYIIILNKNLKFSIGTTYLKTFDKIHQSPINGGIIASTSELCTETGGYIVMLHELCHLLLEKHCKNKNCIMHKSLVRTLPNFWSYNNLFCQEHYKSLKAKIDVDYLNTIFNNLKSNELRKIKQELSNLDSYYL